MLKFIAAAAAVGALCLTALHTPAAASPADCSAGAIQANAEQPNSAKTLDMSAQRRRAHRRHRGGVRVYTYPGPQPYGYYGPTRYERPYRRPAPVFLGVGGHW